MKNRQYSKPSAFVTSAHYGGIRYPFSLNFGLGIVLLATVLLMLAVRNLVTFGFGFLIQLLFGLLTGSYLVCVLFLTVRRIIPALRNETALEFTADGLIDYARKKSISWKDIKEINLVPGKSALMLNFILFNPQDEAGDSVNISLRWVRGWEDKIYETALAYWERAR